MAALSKRNQDVLREKGYVPVKVAADRIGRNRPSLDRLARSGRIKSIEVAGIRVLEWQSLLEFLGPETVQALDLEPMLVPTPIRTPPPPPQPDAQRELQRLLAEARLEMPKWMREGWKPKTR